MDVFAVVILCVVSAVLSFVLKQYKPEYAVFISLACSVVVILYLLRGVSDIAAELEALLSGTLIPSELLGVVFKALGICILTELAGQTCKDAGEGAIATKIELAGRIALLFVGIPLFLQLLETAARLISMG